MTEAEWKSDWRNHGEEAYLMGKTLQYQVYHECPESHHEHCTFCWMRISEDMEGDERGGYVCGANGTEYWICRECFEKLKEFFGWKVVPMQEEQERRNERIQLGCGRQ